MSGDVLIQIQETPNPSAWKFILDRPVLNEGKASYSSVSETGGQRLADDLLNIDGVKQVHFFQNVITVTARFDAEADDIQAAASAVIHRDMPMHNPDFGPKDVTLKKREGFSPELLRIEEILDRTIRPGLQGDGGDIEVVKFEDNKLYVIYQGACGTCPSATAGTLMAIEGILRDEFSPEIEVVPLS